MDVSNKLKQHWFTVIVVLVLLYVIGNFFGMGGGMFATSSNKMMAMESMATDAGYGRGVPSHYYGEDFAPEVEERKIEKSASLGTEVEKNDFEGAESRMKVIVSDYEGLLLNQNVYERGSGKSKTGTYSLKVPTTNYDSVITKLKEIGEITSFNENARDVTGQYLNTEEQLLTEKARLLRYEKLYQERGDLEDKLRLEDAIFNQERRIKSLERSLESMDQRIEYSSISFTITELESGWERIGFIRLSDLAKNFVNSLKGLLVFLAYVLPWIIALLIIWVIVRLFKRK